MLMEDTFEELDRAVRTNDIRKVSEVMTSIPNLRDPGFSWILNDAIRLGHTDVSRILLENGVPANSNSQNLSKPSPLIHACRHGNIKLVRLLLEHGAGVNGEMNFGVPPIILAARGGEVDIVQVLLNWGANIDQRIDYDYVIWPHTTRNMNDAEIAVMSAPYEQNTVLIEACRFQRLDIIELLLKHGVDIHATNQAKENVLHIAASPKPLLTHRTRNERLLPTTPEIVLKLLKEGARVNLRNIYGQTPLDRTVSEIDYIANCRTRGEQAINTLRKHFINIRHLVHGGSNMKNYGHMDVKNVFYRLLLVAYLNHQIWDTTNKSCLREFHRTLEVLDLTIGKPSLVFLSRFQVDVTESEEKHVTLLWLKQRQNNCHSLKQISALHIRKLLPPPLIVAAQASELCLPGELRAYLTEI